MEISRIGENKHTKYNHVAPIEFDSIPDSEKEQALKEFAEGSLGLEICLRTMWDNGLKTHACCSGNDSEYDIGYICMEKGIDVFSYLSEELLSNDMISLENEYNQTISFGGSTEEKEKNFVAVAETIKKGKKTNNSALQKKIGQPLNEDWLKEARIFFKRKSGLSEEEITKSERRLELFKILDSGSEAEADAIMPELLDLIGEVNKKLVDNNSSRKTK